ncbi:CENPL [Cervus elaphus hippelaphus]|uniref:Centromere protein L n=1 Tax=Cervus elaphus hippelaphus TaxID=46360 RepID=A0A212CRG3_CEREH|nr:CENPL [Cervus elaphus hippelaphus]
MQTMDSYDTPELTPRQDASSRLKDFFIGATPLQKRLESVRKQTSFIPTPPRRKIPQGSQLQILCPKYLIGVLAYLTELAVFQIE